MSYQINFRMDELESYSAPTLQSLCMRKVILLNLDTNQLVWPLKERVENINALPGKYVVAAAVLEVKRQDQRKLNFTDWAEARRLVPVVETGASVHLSKIQDLAKDHPTFEVWSVCGYRHKIHFPTSDKMYSVGVTSYYKLFDCQQVVQNQFFNSSIQSSKWLVKKGVNKKDDIWPKGPANYRKESLTMENNELKWRVICKTDELSVSWFCICRSYAD